MSWIFWILFSVSLLINILTVWYSIRSAKLLMDFSEDISYFWLQLSEYYNHLDRLLDNDVYSNNPEIKRLVDHTKEIKSYFSDFLHVCTMTDILTDEEVEMIQEESDIEIEEKQEEKSRDTSMPENEPVNPQEELTHEQQKIRR